MKRPTLKEFQERRINLSTAIRIAIDRYISLKYDVMFAIRYAESIQLEGLTDKQKQDALKDFIMLNQLLKELNKIQFYGTYILKNYGSKPTDGYEYF